MSVIVEKFLELLKSLESHNVEYILIGGMAINLHGFARNTEDVDLFIKPTEKNVSNLKKALYNVFEEDDIFEISFEDIEKYAVIRYGTGYDFYIDLISKIGEKFKYSDLSYEIKKIDDVKIRVADVRTLYKLKENTFREIDRLDLKFLELKLRQ